MNELVPLVDGIAANPDDPYVQDVGVSPAELEQFAAEKHLQRLEQIVDAAREVLRPGDGGDDARPVWNATSTRNRRPSPRVRDRRLR